MSQAGRYIGGGSGGGPVFTLTGNSGGPVAPTAGNINTVGTNVITVAGNPGTSTLTASLINGTNGQVIIGGGANPIWANITSTGGSITITTGPNSINLEAAGGGGGTVIETIFNANGIWTKNAATKSMIVIGWNGGCGGGSGAQGLSTATPGGGGGGAGACFYWAGPALFFGATEAVTIGVGGSGGAPQVANNSNGNDGTIGGTTSFGNISASDLSGGPYITVPGGGGNIGNGNGNPGFGGNEFMRNDVNVYNHNIQNTTAGGGQTGDGTPPVTDSDIGIATIFPTCGGGGAGADAGTERAGSNGGDYFDLTGLVVVSAGGSGGVESITINGANGNPGLTTGGVLNGGTGGGGGGGQHAAGAAGNGGNGAIPGGGGGGGGGSLNGTNSGAGGDGGRGRVVVLEFT